MKDGKSLLLLATESGEVELWKAPANGIGSAEQLTKDGKTLRWEAIPSPNGKWIAYLSTTGESIYQENLFVVGADGGEARKLMGGFELNAEEPL
jgi:Tol biopolymer transport system component